MKSNAITNCETYVSKSLAAEDLKCGDFVAVLQEIVECPSFLWSCDPQLLPPGELVRLICRGSEGGTPLKVKAICLPFVFVKRPCGSHATLDVRQHRLVRLSDNYARAVWKATKRGAPRRREIV
jgi:hypothetical protein